MFCGRAEPGHVIATQLSAVMGPASEDPQTVYSAELARALNMSVLFRGVEALLALTVKGVTLWAPTDSSVLGRLLAAYIQHAAQASRELSMQLLVPLDCYPGCCTAGAIMDVWQHPLLSDKWRPIVR
jgi:hypothetical protein